MAFEILCKQITNFVNKGITHVDYRKTKLMPVLVTVHRKPNPYKAVRWKSPEAFEEEYDVSDKKLESMTTQEVAVLTKKISVHHNDIKNFETRLARYHGMAQTYKRYLLDRGNIREAQKYGFWASRAGWRLERSLEVAEKFQEKVEKLKKSMNRK